MFAGYPLAGAPFAGDGQSNIAIVVTGVSATGEVGTVNWTVVVPLHELASVTVIVYTMPAHKLLAVPAAFIAAPPVIA